jgi:single-stranded DNA-specific DHH superfamily exonuclease
MLTKNQIKEIKEHLEKAQNPLFLFDNDQDGLCSFLLLQKYIKRGKGFPIKVSPALTKDYFRKVKELNADYIFVLDQPEISEEFFKETQENNIPLVWIDHHEIKDVYVPDFIYYYNPIYNKNQKEKEEKFSEPTTYLCYQINQQEKDLWLAVVGCIADNFIPDFYKTFKKKYPELSIDSDKAFEIFYKSEIGKISRIIGFGLKDKVSNVIQMMKMLYKAENPYDVLNESKENKILLAKFKEVEKKFNKIIDKAKKQSSEELIFFTYEGDTSMSADISNKLSFLFPDKIIVVAYTKGPKANISIRGKNTRDLLLKAIKPLENSTGGGHPNAAGAQINKNNIDELEKNIKNLLKINGN